MELFKHHSRKEIVNTFLYGGLDNKTYRKIKGRLYQRNIKNLRDIAFFLMIYDILYLLCVLSGLFSKHFIVPYSYLAVISIAYFLLSETSVFCHEKIGRIIYNCFICLFFLFSTLMGTKYSYSGLAVTFNVILVLLPFLFIDPPRYNIPLVISNVVIFIIFTSLYKSGKILFDDIFDATIFGLLAIYCNFVLTSKLIRQFAYEMTIENEKNFDGLTKVYTKELSEHLIAEALKKGYCGVLLIIDVDHFKTFNDSFGHIYGDEVLREVAASLRKNFRQEDIIGRFGGDEFIVFMKDASLENAKKKTDDFMNTLMDTFKEKSPVTCSIGMAEVKNVTTYESLLKKADTALYYSKKHGRNQYHVFKNDA